MKAVIVVGAFPAETGHFTELARAVGLTVYGSTRRMPSLTFQPAPPSRCASRVLEPIAVGREDSSRWLYRRLFSSLDVDRPDIVHVVSEPWQPLALQTATWARTRKFRGLVFHGCDQQWIEGHGDNRAKQLARRRLAKYTLGIAGGFAGENQGATHQSRSGGLPESSPTAVIHTNPRDPSTFRPPLNPEERREARNRLGLPAEGTGVGFMGKLVPQKGARLFVESWQALDGRLNGQAWAAMAGTGPLAGQLGEQADHGPRLLGSLAYPDEVASFLRAVDVFVHPPWSTPAWTEQAPRVLLEAMLSGCVIVASDSGGNAEVLGGNGFLVPERDQLALESGIAQGVAAAEQTGRNQDAREWALAEFSHNAVAQKLEALWLDVLGR